MTTLDTAKNLISFINKSTSPFHAVKESIAILKSSNFECLDMYSSWNLEKGKSYYVSAYDSTLFAFTIGNQINNFSDFRITAAHTDHPGLRIKPFSEMSERGYLKLNIEIYGSPILNTWLDRPLSIAGKVALRSSEVFKPELRLIDMKKPLLIIPNLAIHMNREVNKGVELNRQIDMIPLAAMVSEEFEKENYFINYLAKYLDVKVEDILDFDLHLYNCEEGQLIGLNEEFISSPRLDNLTSVVAAVKAITSTSRDNGINVIALFDNEEIGSRSKQGADSNLMSMVLERIYQSLSYKHTDFYEAIMRSTLLSVDVAHALHPNRPEKNDPTNITLLNQGVSLKINTNQKYAFDTEAIAIIKQLCKSKNINYQSFTNRADAAGGGTLGSLVSSLLPMKGMDIGVPLLAMHSARETMGIKDQTYLEDLIHEFFTVV